MKFKKCFPCAFRRSFLLMPPSSGLQAAVLSALIFLLTGRRSKWLLCYAAAVREAALMMMTGSLKPATLISPRGLISCAHLPPIRLRSQSERRSASSFFSSEALHVPLLFRMSFSGVFPSATDRHLTGVCDPQAERIASSLLWL